MTSWNVDITVDTQGFDDDQLDRLSEGLGSSPGGGGFHHDMTDRLTIGKNVKSADVRTATITALDRILPAFENSGIAGEIDSVEVRRYDAEVNAAKLREAMREMFVGTSEIAEMFGVSRQRISELARTHADFPKPVDRLRSGPVYGRDEIKAFARTWKRKRTGRPRKNAS